MACSVVLGKSLHLATIETDMFKEAHKVLRQKLHNLWILPYIY